MRWAGGLRARARRGAARGQSGTNAPQRKRRIAYGCRRKVLAMRICPATRLVNADRAIVVNQLRFSLKRNLFVAQWLARDARQHFADFAQQPDDCLLLRLDPLVLLGRG